MCYDMCMIHKRKQILADDATEGVSLLLRLRLPWLVVGLLLGLLAPLLVARFETVLAENLHLAFFLPIMVYLSGAVGVQTETIYVRNVDKHRAKFGLYASKELALGLALGAILGSLMGLFAYLWLHDQVVALTVGIAMAINVAIAPIVALTTAYFLHKEHSDPALGAGPFTTVIQDIMSLAIYFIVASIILFT